MSPEASKTGDRVHHAKYLAGMWLFAIVATIGDIMVGTEPDTYGLMGAAGAITIAYGVLSYCRERGVLA